MVDLEHIKQMLLRLGFSETLNIGSEPTITRKIGEIKLIVGPGMCENLYMYDPPQKDGDMPIDVIDNESQIIAKIAKEAARNAIRDTFKLGNPIMILEDGYIVRKYPDGRTETVKKIEKMPVISGKRIYHL